MNHYALSGRYPLNTKEQVKTARDYFGKYLDRFKPAERAKIASSIKKRAAELKVDVDEDWAHNYSRFMDKQAELSPDFNRNIEVRKELCKTAGLNKIEKDGMTVDTEKVLDKIASKSDSATVQELANTLDEFDKLAGLQQDYDVTLNDPIMSVCGSRSYPKYDSVKIAGDLDQYDLARARCDEHVMEKVAGTFNSNVSEAFERNPVRTAANMIVGDKQVLSSLIKG